MNIKSEVDVVVPRFHHHDKQRTSWRVHSYHHPSNQNQNHPSTHLTHNNNYNNNNNTPPTTQSPIIKKEETIHQGHHKQQQQQQQQQQRHHHVPPPCFSQDPSTPTRTIQQLLPRVAGEGRNEKRDGLVGDNHHHHHHNDNNMNHKTTIKSQSQSPSPSQQQQQKQQQRTHSHWMMPIPQSGHTDPHSYQADMSRGSSDSPTSSSKLRPSVSSPQPHQQQQQQSKHDGSSSRMIGMQQKDVRKNEYSSSGSAIYIPPQPPPIATSSGVGIFQQQQSSQLMSPPVPVPVPSPRPPPPPPARSASSSSKGMVVNLASTDSRGDSSTINSCTQTKVVEDDFSATTGEVRLTRVNVLIQASYNLVWDSPRTKPRFAVLSSVLVNQQQQDGSRVNIAGNNDDGSDPKTRIQQAVNLLHEALTVQIDCLGRYHKDVGWTYNFIGTAYWRMGNEPYKALRYYIEARRIFCKVGLCQIRGIDQRINCVLRSQLDYTPDQVGQYQNTLERAIRYELEGDRWREEGELGMAQDVYQKARKLLTAIANHRCS
jgi:hypothetical protein